MLKVGPSWGTYGYGRAWDFKGKSEIAEIIVSRSETCINFIHFLFVEDGGNKLVLSEMLGTSAGGSLSLNTITLDYPHEVITGLTGKYMAFGKNKSLISITFVTNKRKYGPLEASRTNINIKDIIEFEYFVGCKQFGGFFGTSNNGIEAIGIYLKPLEKLTIDPIKKE